MTQLEMCQNCLHFNTRIIRGTDGLSDYLPDVAGVCTKHAGFTVSNQKASDIMVDVPKCIFYRPKRQEINSDGSADSLGKTYRSGAASSFPIWTIPVILLCGVLLVFAYVFAEGQLSQYETFKLKRAAVSGDTFYGNVFVDDVPLFGLTKEQASQALQANNGEKDTGFEVFVSFGEHSWRISSNEVELRWNTDLQLEKAYMIGRTGTLEERYAQVRGLRDPVYLISDYTYDRNAVRLLTDRIVDMLSLNGEDARIVAFDAVNRTFAFSEEKPGQRVDGDSLYQEVTSALDQKRYGVTIPVDVMLTPVPAKVTKADLAASFGRISAYSTKTTSDSNRNTNIRLGAMAINGSSVPANGNFSFNETTGQRTAAKGYMEAGAIENGRTVREIGGGICQVSTTLFNALARANCNIVRRKPHAWPSDYVPRGEDATVDWPGTDLVMKNPTDFPMFIVAWYENEQVFVEIYGRTLGDGVRVDLESETTYSKQPEEVVYTYNPELPIGTTQLAKKPRTGYTVQTYRVTWQNGAEVSRAKFYTSDYRVINEEYEYNDGMGPRDVY